MINKKIAIIGIGNMGQAIALGILKNKIIPPSNLILSNPLQTNLLSFKKSGCITTSDNERAVEAAEVIILAVKPQVIPLVCTEIKYCVKKKLVVSIAAGIKISAIKKFLGKKQPVIRVMPNLCAKVNDSMSCWIKSKEVASDDALAVKEILLSIGKETELNDEKLLHQVTAISGNGPAYFYYLTELLEKSAIKLGVKKNLARKLTEQTLIGSARLLQNTKKTAQDLRAQVTSKKGTTQAAVDTLVKMKMETIIFKAVEAACKRSIELSK